MIGHNQPMLATRYPCARWATMSRRASVSAHRAADGAHGPAAINRNRSDKSELRRSSPRLRARRRSAAPLVTSVKNPRQPQLVISCHADTGFRSHRLIRENDAFVGHLDNFAGVHAVMSAYFSGRMTSDSLRIELTYGEETAMEGACEVRKTLSPDDVVVVVDVTGTVPERDITIEKCRSPRMRRFVSEALEGLSYALYEGCPDPIADADECDVYGEELGNVCFLGIPCAGGDYNAGVVSCREKSIRTASEALVRLAEHFARETHARSSAPGEADKPRS